MKSTRTTPDVRAFSALSIVVNTAREMWPLEAAERLTVAHTLGALLVHGRDRRRAYARLCESDHVDGGVELPVPGAVETMALRLAG